MASDDPVPHPPTRSNFAPWLAGCLGAICALLGVGFYFAWQARSPWPEISADTLSAAKDRWNGAKETSYRLKLKVVGPQSGEVMVVVRDGEPIELERDGQPVRQPRTWSSWTVDGLLQMIRLDLDAVAAEGKQSLYLSGEFDPALGLPRHYRRVKFDPPLETGWDIEEWTTEPSE